MSRKPTEAQMRLISNLRAGCTLVRSFDVYGGYWWWLRPTQERVGRTTVEALERAGRVVRGENVRVHSGYHETVYALSSEEAGK